MNGKDETQFSSAKNIDCEQQTNKQLVNALGNKQQPVGIVCSYVGSLE